MSTIEDPQPEDLETFNFPPAVEPSSPLDDYTHLTPAPLASHLEFYAPRHHHHENHSQSQLHQPLIQPPNPFGTNNNAETASITPSQPPSHDATRTNARYGAHRSEEEYLAALRAWAEEQQYVQLDKRGGLPGFYGKEELEDRAERMRRQRKEEKEVKMRRKMERRGTVAVAAVEGGGQVVAAAAAAAAAGEGRRRHSVAHFFRRQSTAV